MPRPATSQGTHRKKIARASSAQNIYSGKRFFHRSAPPSRSLAHGRARRRYSHFLNLKNQNVKHETKIIRHTANIYPAGMTCPPASITQSSSGMALKFMP